QAPLVFAAAAAGDAVAQQVIDAALDSLASLAIGAARQAGLDGGEVALALGGGVLVGVPDYRRELGARLARHGFGAPRLVDGRAAARGAAQLAHAWHCREEPLC